MKTLGITLVLGLLAGAWAMIAVERPPCDSSEAEEAALVAQDYLNAQHTHGYKYALNRIEDIKVYTSLGGDRTYKLEVDLLETNCHVLDPTPLANCTVRQKVFTAVEGDCDVVLKSVAGALTVTAFKCKTEESTEDLCLGCPLLLPLNNTDALDLVRASVATINNMTENKNTMYMHTEIGRLSSQLVSGGPIYLAEFLIFEAECIDDACVPLINGSRGFCSAQGSSITHSVECKMLPQVHVAGATDAAAGATDAAAGANGTGNAVPVLPVLSRKHGMKFHQLTNFHNPQLNEYLSAESAESDEVVPVAADAGAAVADPTAAGAAAADPTAAAPTAADPAPAVDSGSASDSSNSAEVPVLVFKRDVPIVLDVVASPAIQDPVVLVPLCPGKVKYF